MEVEVGEEDDEGGGVGYEGVVHPLGEVAVDVERVHAVDDGQGELELGGREGGGGRGGGEEGERGQRTVHHTQVQGKDIHNVHKTPIPNGVLTAHTE